MNSLNTTLLLTLQNLSEVGVIATDGKGLIHFFNRGAGQLLGYHREEVHSIDICLLLCTVSVTESQSITNLEAIFSTSTRKNPFTFIHKNGQAIQVEVSIEPYAGEKEFLGGYIFTFSTANIQLAAMHWYENKPCEPMMLANGNRQQATEILERDQTQVQVIFESSFDALFLVEAHTGCIANCNQQAMVLYEAGSKNRIEGIPLESLFKEAFTVSQKNQFYEQLAHTSRFETEVVCLTFSGREFYGHLSKTDFMLSQTSYYLISISDITQRVIAQRRQQQSEERLTQLIQGMRDAMFIYPYLSDKMPGKFTSVNHVACQMLGYTREELLTLSPFTLNAPEMKKQEAKRVKDLFEHKHAIFENIVLAKDGRRIPVEISTTILEVEGIPTGLSLMRDISGRKQMEEESQGIQASFRAIFDESPIGMAIIDETGRLIKVNKSYCHMMGYEKEELLQLRFSDFTHPDDLQANLEVRRRMLKGEITSYQLEKRYITKNKGYIWARLTGIGFKQNNNLYTVGIAQDITERKKAELILQESERRLQEAEKNAGVGSWEADLATGEINLSNQFFNIYELTEEADKLPFYTDNTHGLTYTHPDDLPFVEKRIRESFDGHKDFNFEHRIITRLGKVLHISTIARFSFDDEGIPVKASGTIQNITERKKREEELLKAKQQAEEAALAKQQFLSTMSHELRTPMNAVIGLTHLLLEENPLPEQLENLQTLKFSSENLLALINDILDFSKIEAGKINLEHVNFSVRSLVSSIINSLQLKANEKGIALVLRIDEQIPQLVAGDPVRLTQVLNNLLSNAIKFTKKGSVTLNIVLEESFEDYVHLHFAVIDTGIGIPEDKFTHIFESFSQAGNDITRRYGGTGLGLAITRRLLELQGSAIQVKSKLGEGSTFYFSLRVGTTVAGQEKVSLYANHASQITSLEFIRLLLVEDNEINQKIATKFLTKWNIYPDYANNGLEAIEKVRQKRYDVILMDLQMPEMNGYEATQTIRSFDEDHFKQIPIIALTADAVMDVKERALAAGMSDFITKPFNPDELYHKLIRYVNRGRQKTQTLPISSWEIADTMTTVSYKQVYELAAGDMLFLEQLIHSSIEQIQEFKGVVHEIIEARNKTRFESAVHKIQPMIRLFEMNMLAFHLEETRNLMVNAGITPDELNYKIIEIMRACNSLTEKLAQPQHQS